MENTYTIEQYLLDRANINDTVVRMMHAFDSRVVADLVDLVYTPEILLDYDSRMGGRPRTTTSEEWATKVARLHAEDDFTQHLVYNILIELPRPTAKAFVTLPETCVVRAYAHGLFYNQDEHGQPRIMTKRNGGDYTLELVRVADLEDRGENPWRIRKHKSRLAWQDRPLGSTD